MGPEETNTPLWQTVFETGHGSGESGIANYACTCKNDVVEKHVARPLGQDLFETPDPSQENPNDSNKGLYGDEAQTKDLSSNLDSSPPPAEQRSGTTVPMPPPDVYFTDSLCVPVLSNVGNLLEQSFTGAIVLHDHLSVGSGLCLSESQLLSGGLAGLCGSPLTMLTWWSTVLFLFSWWI
ncbi:hypothetical protein UY3_10585 [Chelonia mydas]|uniref:Uncharacterized protein n=1 Tax=Chelonia mydas TaxID=8469 RepID=M7BVZ3_CHEMY|nr:hypothetical protein UY3_10585 [Chelonia mydas]